MSQDTSNQKICIIDNGSTTMKAGFPTYTLDDPVPTKIFPSIVGHPKQSTSLQPRGYYSAEIQQFNKDLSLIEPIKRGIVNNWDEMERMWQHIFEEELRIKSKEYAVLMSDRASSPDVQQQRMTEIMFERFDTPKFYLELQGLLSLYQTGRTSGVSVVSGDGMTQSMSFYEGRLIRKSVQELEFGGREITKYLQELVKKTGTTLSDEVAKQLKETKFMFYVAINYDEELTKPREPRRLTREYKLPDGKVITLTTEQLQLAEVLFKPDLIKLPKDKGLHQMTYQTIMASPEVYRNEFFENVVFGGGSTMFDYIDDRMEKELKLLAPKAEVYCYAPPERDLSPWMGGSVITSLDAFEDFWIKKVEYDEVGRSIVHRKCRNMVGRDDEPDDEMRQDMELPMDAKAADERNMDDEKKDMTLMEWYASSSMDPDRRKMLESCVGMSVQECVEFLKKYTKRNFQTRDVQTFQQVLAMQSPREKDNKLKTKIMKNAMVVMIGISEYDEKLSGYKNLDGVKKDVENFRSLFKDVLKYEWRVSQSKLTKKELLQFVDPIAEELRTRSKQSEENFGMIVIYCGHGELNDELVMSDGGKVNLTLIRNKLNHENLGGFEDTPKVLIVDACRGESMAIKRKVEEQSQAVQVRGKKFVNVNDEFIIIRSTTEGFSAPDYGMVSKVFGDVMSSSADGKTTIEQIVKLIRTKIQEKTGDYCVEITATHSFELYFQKNV